MDNAFNMGEEAVGMTDLQFMSYKEERDKRERLEKRIFAKAVCQLVKSHAESGKSSEEILAAVETFANTEI